VKKLFFAVLVAGLMGCGQETEADVEQASDALLPGGGPWDGNCWVATCQCGSCGISAVSYRMPLASMTALCRTSCDARYGAGRCPVTGATSRHCP
jgi:hypothetical protein